MIKNSRGIDWGPVGSGGGGSTLMYGTDGVKTLNAEVHSLTPKWNQLVPYNAEPLM